MPSHLSPPPWRPLRRKASSGRRRVRPVAARELIKLLQKVHPGLDEGIPSFIPALVAPDGCEGTFMQVLIHTDTAITVFFNDLDLYVLHR